MRSRILPVLLALAVGVALGAAAPEQRPSSNPDQAPRTMRQPPPTPDQSPETMREPPPTDDQVNVVAKKLYCPVCPNTPLDVCETQACVDWREQIRDQLAAGWAEDAVMDYFVAQYGERVLAEPRRSGFTSLLWVLPLVVVALGLVTLSATLRKWRARSLGQSLPPSVAPPGPADGGIPPDVRAHIEKDLQDLR